MYLTKYITKTVYKDWNCLEWFYRPYSNRKLNYKLTIFSIYYSCTLGEQSLKTRFQGEFCISHSARWGYHHSPCDSLSLLLRYIILIFNYSIRQHQVKYNYIIQILKNTYITPNAQYSYLDIYVKCAYMAKSPWLKHDYIIDEHFPTYTYFANKQTNAFTHLPTINYTGVKYQC